MLLKFHDFQLRRVTDADLEILRNWRNKPEINNYMFTRNYITPEMQSSWYRSLNQMSNWLFIFSNAGTDMGVISFTDFNWEEKYATSNIFMGDESFMGTPYPIIATYFVAKFGFNILDIREVRSKVIGHNENAISLNKSFGFQFGEFQEEENYFACKMMREWFEEKEPELRRVITRYFGTDNLCLDLIIDNHDDPVIIDLLKEKVRKEAETFRVVFDVGERV